MRKTKCCCTKGAEAVLRVLPNSSIPISYHPLFGPHDDLLLLELDEKLLPDVINQRPYQEFLQALSRAVQIGLEGSIALHQGSKCSRVDFRWFAPKIHEKNSAYCRC